jgi:hypothetical protein
VKPCQVLQNKKLKNRKNMLRDYVKNIFEDIITSPRKEVLGKGVLNPKP